ncbi:MAG: hypothetical protein L0Y36_10325 [Planctomycetales bacterium]|nr:hypothetical protein [Planctomycetales bacterium]
MKKPIPPIKKDKSSVWLWFWTLAAVAAGAAGGMFLLFRHAPAAYQPLQPDNPRQVSPYLTHQLGPDFFSRVQTDKPFELHIEQAGLNDIISRYDWPQPLGGDMLLDDPMVIFADQAVFLMGSLKYGNVSSIVTIAALPSMNPDGKMRLNILWVRLGMMPATTLVRTLAQKAFDDNRDSFAEEPQLEAAVRAVIHNEPFEPVFSISDQTLRITRLSIKTGQATLMLEPEK